MSMLAPTVWNAAGGAFMAYRGYTFQEAAIATIGGEILAEILYRVNPRTNPAGAARPPLAMGANIAAGLLGWWVLNLLNDSRPARSARQGAWL